MSFGRKPRAECVRSFFFIRRVILYTLSVPPLRSPEKRRGHIVRVNDEFASTCRTYEYLDSLFITRSVVGSFWLVFDDIIGLSSFAAAAVFCCSTFVAVFDPDAAVLTSVRGRGLCVKNNTPVDVTSRVHRRCVVRVSRPRVVAVTPRVPLNG